MSIDKFTGRGFGASGAASSSWSAPRDSYKSQNVDHGTSFLMGGGGLRGRPQGVKSADSGLDSKAESALSDSRDLDRDPKKHAPLLNRGAIVHGASVFRAGDRSSNFSEQYGVFVVIAVVALVAAFAIRWFAMESEDADWIEERRSIVRYQQAE